MTRFPTFERKPIAETMREIEEDRRKAERDRIISASWLTDRFGLCLTLAVVGAAVGVYWILALAFGLAVWILARTVSKLRGSPWWTSQRITTWIAAQAAITGAAVGVGIAVQEVTDKFVWLVVLVVPIVLSARPIADRLVHRSDE